MFCKTKWLSLQNIIYDFLYAWTIIHLDFMIKLSFIFYDSTIIQLIFKSYDQISFYLFHKITNK